MSRFRPSDKTKFLVLLGYLLLLIIMVIGLISVYNTLVDFSEKRIENDELKELIIVGNAVSKLYEIESHQNLLNANNARRYFEYYDSIKPMVFIQLDSLSSLTNDAFRKNNLDSIKFLINEKNQNLADIAVLLDSIEKTPGIITDVSYSTTPKKTNAEISKYLEEINRENTTPEVLQTDTTVVRGTRRRLLDRVRDVFTPTSDSTVVIETQVQKEVVQKDLQLIVDTIVNMVRYSERLDLANQRRFQLALLSRQAAMTATNNMLTSRIDNLLKRIEQEEFEKSIKLLADKDAALNSSQRIMLIVSSLAILIGIVFGLLLLADFNKSQRYRRELEASNKRISELLASRVKLMLAMSHDIKAPMNSILGFIELMRAGDNREKKGLYLENMKKSGEHVLQLVSALLDYHKLEAGTWVLNEMNFNAHALVNDTASSFQPLAKAKNLKFTLTNKVPRHVKYFGDPYALRQIMSNIISNAVKYTPQGQVSVLADVLERDNQPWLNISVKDTGPGISEKDQAIIFQEFRQLKLNEDDIHIEGTGLGLSITKGLMDEMGGSIRLDSVKGKGSEFFLHIPLKPKHGEVNHEATPEIKDNLLGKLSVLLVDDDPVQLMMTSEMLHLKKMHVLTETNPAHVEDILRENKFDVVLMDIQMPDMNGFELVELLRNSDIEDVESLPIIALSAQSDMSKNNIRLSGFTDFLNQPFTTNQLYAIIDKHTKKLQVAEPSAEEMETENFPPPAGVEALIEVVKDDKQISIQLLETFVNETKGQLTGLEQAFRDDDVMEIARLSHKMLPLFRMISDQKLVSLLVQAEKEMPLTAENRQETLSGIRNYLQDAEQLKNELQNQ